MNKDHLPIETTLETGLTVLYVQVEIVYYSYRKKNEYVYVDRPDDDVSSYHQSLSRASSLKELRPGSYHRQDSARTQDSYHTQDSLHRQSSGQYYRDGRGKARSSSLHRYINAIDLLHSEKLIQFTISCRLYIDFLLCT